MDWQMSMKTNILKRAILATLSLLTILVIWSFNRNPNPRILIKYPSSTTLKDKKIQAIKDAASTASSQNAFINDVFNNILVSSNGLQLADEEHTNIWIKYNNPSGLKK